MGKLNTVTDFGSWLYEICAVAEHSLGKNNTGDLKSRRSEL